MLSFLRISTELILYFLILCPMPHDRCPDSTYIVVSNKIETSKVMAGKGLKPSMCLTFIWNNYTINPGYLFMLND
jgi:hypothetical protein